MKLVDKKRLPLFVLFLAAGFALGTLFGEWRAREDFGPPGRHGRGPMKERMMERFSSELRLTDEQKTKVAEIFERHHEKMMKIHEETFPRFEALRTEIAVEIKAVLTPEQQVKFDEIHAEIGDRFRKHRERFQDWKGAGGKDAGSPAENPLPPS